MNLVLAQRMKQRRTELNMSQSEFAEALGLTANQKSRISDWENGKRKIPVEDVENIANVLKTTPAYLLGYDDSSNNPIQVSVQMKMVVSISADEYSTLTKLRTLDEHGKQLVNTVLELEYERCSTAGQLPDHLDNGEVDEQIAQSEKLHKSLDKCTRSGA